MCSGLRDIYDTGSGRLYQSSHVEIPVRKQNGKERHDLVNSPSDRIAVELIPSPIERGHATDHLDLPNYDAYANTTRSNAG